MKSLYKKFIWRVLIRPNIDSEGRSISPAGAHRVAPSKHGGLFDLKLKRSNPLISPFAISRRSERFQSIDWPPTTLAGLRHLEGRAEVQIVADRTGAPTRSKLSTRPKSGLHIVEPTMQSLICYVPRRTESRLTGDCWWDRKFRFESLIERRVKGGMTVGRMTVFVWKFVCKSVPRRRDC